MQAGLIRAFRWMREDPSWLIITLAVWATICVYAFAVYGGLGDLVWEQADARHYKWLADSLVTGEFDPSSFQLGLPLLLAPLDVLTGTQHDRTLEAANALNPYSIALLAGLVLPATFCLIGAAGAAVLNSRRAAVPVALVALALTIVYIRVPPPYVGDGDAHFQPLLMLGLVPAVEPLNLLFSAFLCFAIARPRAIPPLALGAAIGFAAMVKETNILLAVVFGLFYLLSTRDIVRGLRIAAAAVAVYSVQLVYNLYVYGDLLFPNRSRQWSATRAEGFSSFVDDRYGLKLDVPPRMSVDYLPHNLREAAVFYALPLLALAISSVWLWTRVKAERVFVAFCVTSIAVFGLVHLAYIRPGATFRYMQAIAPEAFLLLMAGLWFAVTKAASRTPAEAHGGSIAHVDTGAWRARAQRLRPPGLGAQPSWRWLLAGVGVALAVASLFALLSGGGNHGGKGERAASTGGPVCQPQETKPPPAGRTHQVGTAAIVDLSGDPRERLLARVTIAAVRHPRAIRDRFTGQGTFHPAPGTAFAAVVYRFENVGSGTIEAASTVHRAFAVEAGGKAWSSESRACPPLSSSFAGDVPGASSPQTDVGPGRGYKTVSVYTVPGRARRLAWAGLGHRFQLR